MNYIYIYVHILNYEYFQSMYKEVFNQKEPTSSLPLFSPCLDHGIKFAISLFSIGNSKSLT